MIFFFILYIFINSKLINSSVILVPGLFGSNLYGSYNENVDIPWYCPKKMNDELLWIPTKLVLPPFLDCVAYLTQPVFNNKTQKVQSNPNVNITVKDFGKHTSVDYVIKNQNKFKEYDTPKPKGMLDFYDNFGSFINFFVEKGYEIGKNFFITPYDWRLAPLFIDDFWTKFKDQIENAYHASNDQKVTLVGFSMGCFMIQQFLASERILKENKNKMVDGRPILTSIKDPKIAVTQEWIDKYIEKVVFLAPSFGGCMKVFDSMQRRFSPLVPFWRSKYIADMTTSVAGIYSHWPNLQIFKGLDLVRGPDGQNYTVEQLRDLVVNYSNIDPSHIPIMDYSIDSQRNAPIDIGEKIPLTIIYNSKIPTASFLDYKYGWNHDPVRVLEGKGDGTVPIIGIRYACDNWNADKRRLVCIDIEKDDANRYNHGKLTSSPFVFNVIYDAITGNSTNTNDKWWLETGKADIHLGNYGIEKDLKDLQL